VNGTEVPFGVHVKAILRWLSVSCIRWRQGTSESADQAQGSLVDASAASPTGDSSGPSTLILILGGIVGRIHCRAVYLALVLLLWAGSDAAFGSRTAPKLAETIDLPQTFESDFQFAAKQRAQLGSQREVPDDTAGRVGEDVFESLVKNEMISDFRLPTRGRSGPTTVSTPTLFSCGGVPHEAAKGRSETIFRFFEKRPNLYSLALPSTHT
jgi:hypothetical protein